MAILAPAVLVHTTANVTENVNEGLTLFHPAMAHHCSSHSQRSSVSIFLLLSPALEPLHLLPHLTRTAFSSAGRLS